MFEARLDGACNNLILWVAGGKGLEPGDFYGPFQPKSCYDSMYDSSYCKACTQMGSSLFEPGFIKIIGEILTNELRLTLMA